MLIELANAGGDRASDDGWHTGWHAQYLLSPPPLLAPGTYCRNCAHSEIAYLDRMVPGRKGEHVPCCSRKECGCTAHMSETFEVGDEARGAPAEPTSEHNNNDTRTRVAPSRPRSGRAKR